MSGGDPAPAPLGTVDQVENRDTTDQENEKQTTADSTSKLELFQEKQKLIEEQNRKRKEMLAKEIIDLKKKTDSESKKLDIVHQELQKIDLMLNTDVQFLRDSIEQASFDFMEAQ